MDGKVVIGTRYGDVEKLHVPVNEDIYMALSFDPKSMFKDDAEKGTASFYVAIETEDSYDIRSEQTWIKKEYYETFLREVSNNIKCLELGRAVNGNWGDWSYILGICYSLRLYKKPFTIDNAKANYDRTSSFHKYIIESNKK